MENPVKYPVYTLRFWQAYFVHMRPYLLFISGIAGMAGMALSSSFLSGNLKTWLSFLVFFLSYGFGQALTDCFQIDTDKISAPYRPLSQGIVSPRAVGGVSVLGLVSGVALLIYFNPWNALFGLLSIVGLATYTKFKRDYWFAGPFYNAWIVGLLPVMGYLTMEANGTSCLADPSLWILAGMSFFAYAGFVIIGYLKDITADRETGYHTFPVIFGWEKTVWVGDLFALFGLSLSAVFAFQNGWSMAVWILGTVTSVAGQGYAHFTKDKTEKNAAFPVAATVRSFILWHLAAILALQVQLVPFAIGYYILFEMTLHRRPESGQI